jgi:hypothetical protein
MWQKCPICYGAGSHPTTFKHYNGVTPPEMVCKICTGKGIISELTGKPPEYMLPKEGRQLELFPNHSDKK